jgi:beta-lactamase superfamily II metal-dependent hydrolase
MGSDAPGTVGADRLVVYLLGSGYGESQIVLFPGDEQRCMVVDSCMSKRGGRNLTAELLRKLERRSIDLLVVTHADADHIGGTPALIDEFDPQLVWYSPFASGLRALVAQWLRADPKNERCVELAELLKRLKHLRERDRADVVLWNSEPWAHRPGGCIVKPVAPVSEDDAALSARLDKMLAREEGKGWIVSSDGRALLDGGAPVGDRPNRSSIAVGIQWGSRRVLLSGDVERSHWTKVLKKLDRGHSPHSDILRELDVIKVAHHGSDGAFCAPAWEHHRKEDGSIVALIAPFDDAVKLPGAEALSALLRYAGRLGVTSNAGGAFDRASTAGWSMLAESDVTPLDVSASLLAVVLRQDGSTELQASSDARFFSSPRSSVWKQLLRDDL